MPTSMTMQAFTAWHGLVEQYSRQPLVPSTVCSIVEDMALVLPDLAQGEAPWSPLDDHPETGGEGCPCILRYHLLITLRSALADDLERSCA